MAEGHGHPLVKKEGRGARWGVGGGKLGGGGGVQKNNNNNNNNNGVQEMAFVFFFGLVIL